MDEAAHLGFAYVAFVGQPWLLVAVFFALVPDMLAAPFALLQVIKKRRLPTAKELTSAIREPYYYSHSILLLALAALVALLVRPDLAFPMALGWGFHLAIDLFSHKDSPVGERRPFYPLTRVSFNGLFHWKTRKALAATYAVLAVLFMARVVLKLF